METGVNKLLEGTGEAIKTVPELYDDGLKPAVQESGKTLSLLPKTINAALVPLRKWIAEREYSLAETEKLLEIKLRNIDYNKIVTPEAYVAVPALQAISYSMDSEELRNRPADARKLKELELEGQNLSYDKMLCIGKEYDEEKALHLCKEMKRIALEACKSEDEKAEVGNMNCL